MITENRGTGRRVRFAKPSVSPVRKSFDDRMYDSGSDRESPVTTGDTPPTSTTPQCDREWSTLLVRPPKAFVARLSVRGKWQ